MGIVIIRYLQDQEGSIWPDCEQLPGGAPNLSFVTKVTVVKIGKLDLCFFPAVSHAWAVTFVGSESVLGMELSELSTEPSHGGGSSKSRRGTGNGKKPSDTTL